MPLTTPTPSKPTQPLTPRQAEILEFIAAFWARERFGPTMQEIADGLGVCKVTIFEHVGSMVKKGWLTQDRFRARTIRPVTGACPCCGQTVHRVPQPAIA